MRATSHHQSHNHALTTNLNCYLLGRKDCSKVERKRKIKMILKVVMMVSLIVAMIIIMMKLQ